jgi:glycine cleavage system H protein
MAQDHEYEIPDDCHYTESDEWVRVDGAVARIGITDFAQSELNDIVFVELPEAGNQLAAGEAFGVVESVKAVSDLVAPLAGRSSRCTRASPSTPEWINEDPYGAAAGSSRSTRRDLEALDGLMSAATTGRT